MTAWVVFIRTESTGEVLLRSARRLAGTGHGVVFGYSLARKRKHPVLRAVRTGAVT
ncbi:hypothetical protein [Streptomyces sp. NPDC096323]|uniref:hypothetical protein n=1 Tax=Streptomyces sp. NPDC096323 TaxID=3155822 RepID=UPI003326C9FE